MGLKFTKESIGEKVKLNSNHTDTKKIVFKYIDENLNEIKENFKKRLVSILKDEKINVEKLFEFIYNELYRKFNLFNWNKFVSLSKKGKFGKEINYCINKNKISCLIEIEKIQKNLTISSKKIIDSYLLLLGIIRELIIKILFQIVKNKIKKKYNLEETQIQKYSYKAFGSTNITSDYDLSIIGGKYSNEIMWSMFKLFCNLFDNSLPENFDSNLYVGSYDIVTDDLKDFTQKTTFKNPENIEMFCIGLKTEKDFKWGFIWSLIKLYEAGVNEIELKNEELKNYYLEGKEFISKIKDKYCDSKYEFKTDRDFKYLNNNDIDVNFKKIVKNYYFEYYFQKIIDNYIYNNINIPIEELNRILGKESITPENDLILLRGLNNFFSSEAYYTDATVQVVVLEGQAGYKLNLDKRNYLIASIENLADFYKHVNSEIKHSEEITNKIKFNILVKYSKYIYRIYNSLGKINNEEKYVDMANGIKKTLIELRKTYNYELKNQYIQGLNILNIDENNDLNSIINEIKENIINEIISNYENLKKNQEGGTYYKKYLKYKKKYNKLKENNKKL